MPTTNTQARELLHEITDAVYATRAATHSGDHAAEHTANEREAAAFAAAFDAGFIHYLDIHLAALAGIRRALFAGVITELEAVEEVAGATEAFAENVRADVHDDDECAACAECRAKVERAADDTLAADVSLLVPAPGLH